MVVQVGFGYWLISARTDIRSSSSYTRLEMVVQVGFGYSLTSERTDRRSFSSWRGWKWWCRLGLATSPLRGKTDVRPGLGEATVVQVGFGYSLTSERTDRRSSSS
jgi:hypothetical protein